MPYTPQQNGTAERSNRTILDTARTIMKDSPFPKSFWPEAMQTAVFILNRLVIRDGKSAYELFTGHEAPFVRLYKYGTAGFVKRICRLHRNSLIEAHVSTAGSDPDSPTFAEAIAGLHKSQWLEAIC